MKNLSQVIWRLLKVVYVLFLLCGLLIGWLAWVINTPYSYTTYGYLVTCDNGKTFDPTSKPIAMFRNGERVYFDSNYNDTPLEFSDNQIKIECKYGGSSEAVYPVDNVKYDLTNNPYSHVVRAQSNQLNATIITLVVYYLILEILRRIFLYIFLGKSFITLSKKEGDK